MALLLAQISDLHLDGTDRATRRATRVMDFLRALPRPVAPGCLARAASLTRGVHLHTVEAPRPDLLAAVRTALAARGYLLTE